MKSNETSKCTFLAKCDIGSTEFLDIGSTEFLEVTLKLFTSLRYRNPVGKVELAKMGPCRGPNCFCPTPLAQLHGGLANEHPQHSPPTPLVKTNENRWSSGLSFTPIMLLTKM